MTYRTPAAMIAEAAVLESANPNSKETQRAVAALRHDACTAAGALYTYERGDASGRVFYCTRRGGGFNAIATMPGLPMRGFGGIKDRAAAEAKVRELVDAFVQMAE